MPEPAERIQKERATVEERFWAKVRKSKSGCWKWTGTITGNGYGQIDEDGRHKRAHRVSWRLHHGPIPSGMCVLHKCDNGLCVRPDHLFLGTHKDNMGDMVRKGRSFSTVGERNHSALVTACDVREIRRLCLGGLNHKQIAARCVLSHQQIQAICTGTRWAHTFEADMAALTRKERPHA